MECRTCKHWENKTEPGYGDKGICNLPYAEGPLVELEPGWNSEGAGTLRTAPQFSCYGYDRKTDLADTTAGNSAKQ